MKIWNAIKFPFEKFRNAIRAFSAKSVHFRKITLFEVAISGMLFAMFLLFFGIKKILLPGPLNIEVEHLFYILVGLIFPLGYGIFFAVLCDFSKMFLFGRIYDWSYVYAIAAPLIVIVSWSFFSLYRKNKIAMLIFASILLSITMYLNILFVAYNAFDAKLLAKLSGVKKVEDAYITSSILILISVIYALCVTVFIATVWIKYAMKKRISQRGLVLNRNIENNNNEQINKLLTIFMIFALVALISVLFRWAWGNFALVHFLNSKRGTGSIKPLIPYFSQEYFAFGIWMVIKSGIETLLFTSVLIPLYTVLIVLKQKYMIDLQQIRW
ncbi:hypothetical protein [Mycoplasma phocimorsus]|uniref:ECF transporter S component n=1 Tax=Mycoplasma phocimorsus TaxID=3045839 RepID=A0AAJ1PTR0_9MOLU|nr:hypothetical protein [Mycoplasma phocimorsus]MDJ1646027.1 hypothetical protein [Mycoplasma phocimorsus]MDJ1646913.1 hypothetical protein [Mycoplasma phocimorsus]MDJ1647880.1 hypothetical protein [Mycoplasma phocimorsus]MDJ1648420.1 hypothetical protein [Mycoplasma phocimorsus]MDJ1648559.1 hypothetical protein [Mycoplasma phocimorsus]